MIQLTTQELNAERLAWNIVECPWCYHPVSSRFEFDSHIRTDCTEIKTNERLAIIRKEI